MRVSGSAEDGESATAEQILRLSAGRGGSTSELRLLYDSDTERYFLRSNRYDAMFNTSAYDAERLRDAALAFPP